MQSETILKAIAAGTEKCTRPASRLFTLSILAGAFIGLGGILSLILGYGWPQIAAANPALPRLLSGLAFPLGLFLIVMFGADLFTGNNALAMAACNQRNISPADMLLNWTLVWIGNFIGCLLFAVVLVHTAGLVDTDPYRSAIIKIAETKASLPPLTTFVKAIGANWCVCLAVWLAIGAKSLGTKALACWLPVAAFVALGYEHCIANMFFIPCGMLAGAQVGIAQLALNLLFSTLGNIVGGALMVGHLFYKLYAPCKQ